MIPSRNANSATARSLPPCALMADGTSRRSTTQKCAYAAAMTTLDLRRAAGAARCFCSARCEDDEHPARGTRDSGGPSRRERRRAVLQLQQLWNADAADDADEADPLGVARQQSPNEPGRSSRERPRAGFGKSSQLEVFSKAHLLSRAPSRLGRGWSARHWRLRAPAVTGPSARTNARTPRQTVQNGRALRLSAFSYRASPIEGQLRRKRLRATRRASRGAAYRSDRRSRGTREGSSRGRRSTRCRRTATPREG